MLRNRPWPVKVGLIVAYALLGTVVAVLAARFAQSGGADGRRAPVTAASGGPTAVASDRPTSVPATAPTAGPSARSSSTRSSGPATTRPVRKPASRRPTSTVVVRPRRVDLAARRPVTVSSQIGIFAGGYATDGDRSTYWEGARGFPQTLRVDLGSVTTVGRLELLLPDEAGWNRRKQRIVVLGSRDARSFTTLAAARTYVFDANSAAHNAVSIAVPKGGRRFVELRFVDGDGWPAAQLAELRVHSR